MSTPKLKKLLLQPLLQPQGLESPPTEWHLKKPPFQRPWNAWTTSWVCIWRSLRGEWHLHCWSTYMTYCGTPIPFRNRQLRVQKLGFQTALQCWSSKHTHKHVCCFLQPQSWVDLEHNRTQTGQPNHKRNDKILEAMLCKTKRRVPMSTRCKLVHKWMEGKT